MEPQGGVGSFPFYRGERLNDGGLFKGHGILSRGRAMTVRGCEGFEVQDKGQRPAGWLASGGQSRWAPRGEEPDTTNSIEIIVNS